MCSYALSRTSKRSKGCGASEKAISDPVKCINEMLTNHICCIIFSFLEDSRDIGRASCTCRGFNEAGKNVRSVRWVCRNEDHENARKARDIKKPLEDDHGETSQINSECMDVNNRSHDSSLDSFGNEVQGSSPGQRTSNESRRRLDEESGAHKTQGSTDENLGVPFGSKSGYDKPNNFKEPVDGREVCESSKSRQHQHMPFREAVEQGLKSKPCIQQLRIEIEPKLQSKSVDVNERQLTDHWLSDPHHLQRWVPFVGDTLQHVCIADYGPQAITRQSPILKIFSQNWLWHSMELNLPMVMEVKKWPPVKTLILHMIPQTLVNCVTLLEMFQLKMRDTLVNLEIYVHTTSPVDGNDFFAAIQDQVAHLSFKRKVWTKSLNFSCFTF
ncbi:hypothetical protein BDL97_02G083100 [Sphagnum fallax]|nr:hypothetical protein BDL97_02G083100 [Sphagnum fallax]